MNQALVNLIILFFIAGYVDFFFVSKWTIYKKRLKEENDSSAANKNFIFRQVFYEDTREYWRNSRFGQAIKQINFKLWLEIFILALWAIYIGWGYLDMDPRKIPAGGELGSAIPSNHLWTQIIKCGWCATWNGFQRGGFPAFADVQGSMLHPIVMITTLLFGVINGVKITLVISFWIAGVAQWWIARELNLGWVPRMWSAGIAIAGGHLASRMELGIPGLVLSTATTSLMFAALIRMSKESTRKNAIILGICTASALVSGQGYIQIGLIAIIPVYILFFCKKENLNNFLLAAVTAFLLAAPFLVPFLHFSPNITKEFDPQFTAAQPISYFILNLLIDDRRYYYSNVMAKYPYPYLYSLYIGWTPVLLFIYSLSHISSNNKKIIWFMLAGIATEFLIGSAIILKWLAPLWPALAGIRHSPQIAGLAIPFILGISAYGLDKLLSMSWAIPAVTAYLPVNYSKWPELTKWLIAIPLIYSLQSCAQFSSYWIGTRYLNDDVFQTLNKLKTNDLQWVNPFFGEHTYIEPAIEMGMKLSPGILTWNWRDHAKPQPFMTAEHSFKLNKYTNALEPTAEVIIKHHSEDLYAYIETNSKISACKGKGSGGFIEIECNSDAPGVLKVQENMWSGWYGWMDGNKVDLIGEKNLEVNTPAGKHAFIFRYIPWDVPLGLLFFVIGVFYCGVLWRSDEKLG